MVKNPPSNAVDVGLIPGLGTKIPHAAGQLSPRAATTEPTRSGARAAQLESLCTTTREARAAKIKKQTKKTTSVKDLKREIKSILNGMKIKT